MRALTRLRVTSYALLMDEPRDKEFTVRDHRRFDESGNPRDEAEVEAKSEAKATAPAEEPKRGDESTRPIDFTTFIVSLSSSAFYYLGEVAHPNTGRVERDPALAKQTIDLLGMIEEKTRGNLSADESNVLSGLLYDLRMKYLEQTRTSTGDQSQVPNV